MALIPESLINDLRKGLLIMGSLFNKNGSFILKFKRAETLDDSIDLKKKSHLAGKPNDVEPYCYVDFCDNFEDLLRQFSQMESRKFFFLLHLYKKNRSEFKILLESCLITIEDFDWSKDVISFIFPPNITSSLIKNLVCDFHDNGFRCDKLYFAGFILATRSREDEDSSWFADYLDSVMDSLDLTNDQLIVVYLRAIFHSTDLFLRLAAHRQVPKDFYSEALVSTSKVAVEYVMSCENTYVPEPQSLIAMLNIYSSESVVHYFYKFMPREKKYLVETTFKFVCGALPNISVLKFILETYSPDLIGLNDIHKGNDMLQSGTYLMYSTWNPVVFELLINFGEILDREIVADYICRYMFAVIRRDILRLVMKYSTDLDLWKRFLTKYHPNNKSDRKHMDKIYVDFFEHFFGVLST
jgi:hypothetical protein